jgi:hypothetical protein
MNLYFFKNQLEIPAAMVDIILRARVSIEEWLFKMNQNSRLDSETRKKKRKKRKGITYMLSGSAHRSFSSIFTATLVPFHLAT